MSHAHEHGRGRFSLEEATRRSWYNPEDVLLSAGLRENMVFVDVGCGDGFFSLLAAKMVGGNGIVYSVDVNSDAIQELQDKAKAQGLTNLHATAAHAEEMVFCNGCADMVFFSMVLHDFQDPAKVLVNARKMIKPTGLLVDLDWKKIKMDFGPPFDIRFSEHRAITLIQDAGFRAKSSRHAGKYHYIITAKPVEPKKDLGLLSGDI
jgi:ubiquinone/menaquinone biosynthesis C-methylase UbiE